MRSNGSMLRAQTRTTSAGSGESQSPSAYDSASPRLPCSTCVQTRGERTITVTVGSPRPKRRKLPFSTISTLPTRRRPRIASISRRPAVAAQHAPAIRVREGVGVTLAPRRVGHVGEHRLHALAGGVEAVVEAHRVEAVAEGAKVGEEPHRTAGPCAGALEHRVAHGRREI